MLIGSMLIASIMLPNSNLITDFSNGSYEDNIEIFKNQVNELGQNVEDSIVGTLKSFDNVQGVIRGVYNFFGGNKDKYNVTYSKDYFELYRDKWSVVIPPLGLGIDTNLRFWVVYSGDNIALTYGEAILRDRNDEGKVFYYDVNFILGRFLIYENNGAPLTNEQMLEFEIKYLMD
jgi:hypothetical protein